MNKATGNKRAILLAQVILRGGKYDKFIYSFANMYLLKAKYPTAEKIHTVLITSVKQLRKFKHMPWEVRALITRVLKK